MTKLNGHIVGLQGRYSTRLNQAAAAPVWGASKTATTTTTTTLTTTTTATAVVVGRAGGVSVEALKECKSFNISVKCNIGLNIVVVVVVYYLTIVAQSTWMVEKMLTYGNRLRVTHCREF